MTLQALADLELMVCDHEIIQTYEDPFYMRCSELLLELHDKMIGQETGTWVFSAELLEGVVRSYPWNLTGQVGWIIRLNNSFFPWLRRISGDCIIEPKRQSADLRLEPSIFEEHIIRGHLDLAKERLSVLEQARETVDCHTAVCSFASRPETTTLQGLSGDPPTIRLIRNQANWEAIRHLHNPWLRHQLPQEAEHRMRPRPTGIMVRVTSRKSRAHLGIR